MSSLGWQCPFCKQHATIRDHDMAQGNVWLNISSAREPLVLVATFIVCPNPKCREVTLTTSLHKAKRSEPGFYNRSPVEIGAQVRTWQLVPESEAVALPEYIPEAIREDYREACAIRHLSPKAAATLARRCLQGMIRDRWQVKPGRLVDEIEQIRSFVDPLVWQAIDAVRKVGNIGAHMEEDVNKIIDVEPGEAEKLLSLVKMLIHEWYVVPHERERMMREVVAIAEAKEEQRKQRVDETSEPAAEMSA